MAVCRIHVEGAGQSIDGRDNPDPCGDRQLIEEPQGNVGLHGCDALVDVAENLH